MGAHDGGRALVCRSPAPGPSPDTPDHERRRPRTPPVLVGDPVLRQLRRRQTPPRSATNSRQPGLLERRAPATISFTSPKLTRKPPLPEPLPRSPYVTTTRHREAYKVIQAPYRRPGPWPLRTPTGRGSCDRRR